MVQEVPDSFVCPVTLTMFVNPVICSDGHTYEKVAIERWLENSSTSPITGQTLETKTVICNITLLKALEDWKQAQQQVSRDTQVSYYAERTENVHSVLVAIIPCLLG